MPHLSASAARRLALAAQGFGREHPDAVTPRRLARAVDRLGVLQLDSVSVFTRSHYLPLFARLGAYDPVALDAMLFAERGRYHEYWAHEAAVIRRDDWPLWHWKRELLRGRDPVKHAWVREHGPMLDWLRRELAITGPVTASEIEHDENVRRGPWWGWSDVKHGLEFLFRWGDVVSAGRRGFSRVYALPEQVGLAELHAQHPPRAEAMRTLVHRAVVALGVGAVGDIADYHRLPIADTQTALRELHEQGLVEPVTVEGWMRGARPLPAWRDPAASIPRRIEATALLSPFDPVVWYRDRALRLFDFHYRIEIYTPAEKRKYGYYSLPVLVDDALAGRVDLKSDRKAGVLRVQSVWAEDGVPPGALAERLAPLLRSAAAWQRLDDVAVAGRGNAAAELGVALAR